MTPFPHVPSYSDPTFTSCKTDAACRKAWGLRVLYSSNILVFGAGLYSFFDNYSQTCLTTESCQQNMVDIQASDVDLFGLSTKAATNMVSLDPGGQTVPQADNQNAFCSTLASFQAKLTPSSIAKRLLNIRTEKAARQVQPYWFSRWVLAPKS